MQPKLSDDGLHSVLHYLAKIHEEAIAQIEQIFARSRAAERSLV
jgi:hypothetical protein